MSDLLAGAGTWWLQVAAASDTVLFRQVGGEPTGFEKVASIASGLVSIAILVLTVFLVPAAWNFRRSYAKISSMLDKVYADINPITRHLSSIADNLDYITTSIRVDVQQVNQTVAAATERMHRVMELSERRVKELNALLQVVQEEAEDTFVSAAATLRGVRAGAGALNEDALALHDEMDALDEDELDDVDDFDEELDDGNDDTFAHERPQTGPRIRPRRR
jgi:uncharacterized protein YoxC